MESQVIIDKQHIRIITEYGLYKKILSILIHKRILLVYKVKINMPYINVYAMVTETVFHIIAEITALLPHVIVGVQHKNGVSGTFMVIDVYLTGYGRQQCNGAKNHPDYTT
jgi:hypothetical protein